MGEHPPFQLSNTILCVCIAISSSIYTVHVAVDVSPSFRQIITSSSFTLNDQTAAHLFEMASQGIKLLTSWTTAVMELVSHSTCTALSFV